MEEGKGKHPKKKTVTTLQAILILVLGFVLGCAYCVTNSILNDAKENKKTTPIVATAQDLKPNLNTSSQTNLKNITEGEYKVGEEIPAGEYKIVAAPDCLVLYHVYKFVNGNKQWGDSGNTTGKEYVKVKGGEILHIGSGGHAELLTESN